MTHVINDAATVDGLLLHYKKTISSLKHRVTGAPANLPKDRPARIEALNMGLYNPQVALVWGGDMAYSQLDIYRPYIARSKKRVAIFCKSLKGKNAGDIGLPNTPVFETANGVHPRRILMASGGLTTLLYISDKQDNFTYIRSGPHLTHVFANHGDSDKHSNAPPVAPAYDYMLVADANAARRVIESGVPMPADRLIPMGGSVIEGVVAAETFRDPVNILYTPTWEGYAPTVNFSSAAAVVPLLEAFRAAGGQVRFRHHPGMGHRDAGYKALRSSSLAKNQEPATKAEDFNWADVVIADISGVLSEFLFTRKPIVVPLRGEPWLRDYILSKNLKDYVYFWDPDAEPVAALLERLREDPLRTARLARRERLYYNAINTDQGAALFNTALTQFELTAKFRRMRSLPPARPAPKGFKRLPTDPTLKLAAEAVIRGEAMLRA